MSDIYIENDIDHRMQYVVLADRKHLDVVWNILQVVDGKYSETEKDSMYENNYRWTVIPTSCVSSFTNALETVGLSFEIIMNKDKGLNSFLYLCNINEEYFHE